MKYLSSLLFSLLCFHAFAQELIVHELDPPNATHYSDLEVLRPLLEDKQLVMLGEMTHSFGNIFEMKARVVKYLHEELGFNTFAIEAPMYEVWKMNQKGFSPEEFNKTIFTMWSESSEFQELVAYIEEKNIKVIGFDSQFFEAQEVVDAFFEFCEKNKIRIRLDEDDFGIAMEEVLDIVDYDKDEIPFPRYKKEMERIIQQIKKLPDTEENYYWLQFIKSILSQSLTAFYDIEEIESSDYVNKNHNYRDAQMADNILSYHKRYPEEKIMVWADNIHIIKDMSSYTYPIIKEFKSMGTHISEELGDKAYSLATIYANDSLYNNLSEQWFKVPIEEDSFEAKLLATNKDYLFIDSNQKALQNNTKSRLLAYFNFYEGNLNELYNGYIYLKTATLSKKVWNEEKEYVAKNPSVDNKEDLSVKNIDTKSFSGKLIDAKTKEPIPYANVMVKNLGIYRLTNADGNYTVQIPSNKDVEITFSIMSYEEVTLPENQLTEILELTPSFDTLDEVVLVAHGTTPKNVLQNAIKSIEKNYVLEPFNYYRYKHYKSTYNDEKYTDVEVISKEYMEEGYKYETFYERIVQQVRWNIDLLDNKNKSRYHLPGFREDAIQMSNVFHKRKYKKFEFEFIMPDKSITEDIYIIKFKTKKKRFSYTGRWYPTNYSGVIYINKEDYAILKVIQNRETTIYEEDMEKYEYWLGKFKDKYTAKEEYVSEYQKHTDGKYYASNYFIRFFSEYTNTKEEFVNRTRESKSVLYNYSLENIKVIHFKNFKKDANLNRVNYNPEFWGNFDLEEIKATSILKD